MDFTYANNNDRQHWNTDFGNLFTIVDPNTDVFRYGLGRSVSKYPNRDSAYEDPTILGFTLEIDEELSPLFNGQALRFLTNHSDIPEIKARIPILEEFQKQVIKFFKSQESHVGDGLSSIYIKSHYINSVSGLADLNKKFNDYMEDKLTIEMYEDIALHSTYLSKLYNDLVYSYNNGREILPENLKKFVLRVKISEIRNLKGIIHLWTESQDDKKLTDALKRNTACINYTLWDCHFDFLMSQPFQDSIGQAGIDQALPPHSVLYLDIYYKSVSRYFRSILVSDYQLDDYRDDLGFTRVVYDGLSKLNSSSQLFSKNQSPDDKFEQSVESNYKSTNTAPGFIGENHKKSSKILYGDNFIDSNNNDNVLREQNGEFNLDTDSGIYTLRNLQRQIGDRNNYPIILGYPDVDYKYLDPNTNEVELDDRTTVDDSPQGLINKLNKKLTNTANTQMNRGLNILRAKRQDILTNIVYELRNVTGVQQNRIVPENVYENQTIPERILKRLSGDIGFGITNEILKAFII